MANPSPSRVTSLGIRTLPILLLFASTLLPHEAQARPLPSKDAPLFYCEPWAGTRCSLSDDMKVGYVSAEDGKMSSIGSSRYYYHGHFSVDMKLPAIDSSRLCMAFYLISPGTPNNTVWDHAEIDLEYFGAKDPTNATLATNIFGQTKQALSQFKPPFDPSDGFHTYSIQWNTKAIIWAVDGVPYRILSKTDGKPFPARPLEVRISIWEINWGTAEQKYENGPITIGLQNLKIQGCATWKTNRARKGCPGKERKNLPWNVMPAQSVLDSMIQGETTLVKKEYLTNEWAWDNA